MKPGQKRVRKTKKEPIVFRIIHGPAVVSFGSEAILVDSTKTNNQNDSPNNNPTQVVVGS